MKQLLLLFTVFAVAVGCQKDYYLNDLNDANARIETLQNRINLLNNDLMNQINENTDKAQQLVVLQGEIESLNTQIEELVDTNEVLTEELEIALDRIIELEGLIVGLNDDIAVLETKLADALEETELDEALILSLTQQIAELEAREPEVIIEYITVVETVYSTIDNTDYSQIQQLQYEINELTDRLSALYTVEHVTETLVTTEEYEGVDINGDGDLEDGAIKVYEITIFLDELGNEYDRVTIEYDWEVHADLSPQPTPDYIIYGGTGQSGNTNFYLTGDVRAELSSGDVLIIGDYEYTINAVSGSTVTGADGTEVTLIYTVEAIVVDIPHGAEVFLKD